MGDFFVTALRAGGLIDWSGEQLGDQAPVAQARGERTAAESAIMGDVSFTVNAVGRKCERIGRNRVPEELIDPLLDE